MMKPRSRCVNLNHGRTNVSIRYCPMCGEIVNEDISAGACSEDKHAAGRRRGSAFCMDCGKKLIMKT